MTCSETPAPSVPRAAARRASQAARPLALAAALVAAPLAPSAQGAPPALALPIDCALGETCFVQNHVDRDPGPGFADVACGALGYPGHDGTDFALPDLAAMAAGVDVLASAPGVVMRTRDGRPDVSVRDPAAPSVAGRECGNGVSLDHGGGWSTQYCHLARGSIAVRPGDRVETGDVLGRVGLSGNTEFPHVHLAVRHDGETVDPYDASGTACGDGRLDPLWAEPLPYVSTGVTSAGFLERAPEWGEVKAGGLVHGGARDAPLVLWGQAFGGRAGDAMRLRIEGPGGAVMEGSPTLSRTQVAYFFAEGQYPPEGGWPPGRYTGLVEIRRGGAVMDRAETALTIR